MKRFKFFFYVLLFVIFFAVVGGISYFFLSTKGSRFVVEKLLARYVEAKDIKISQLTGNLVKGIVLQDVDLVELKDFPKESVLKIQKLFVQVNSFSPQGVIVELDNARINLPDADPLLVVGNLKKGVLNFNIFANRLDVRLLVKYLPKSPKWQRLRNIGGTVTNLDIYVSGEYKKPHLIGKVFVEQISYKDFVLINSPADLNLHFQHQGRKLKPEGTITFSGGLIQSKGADIDLLMSRIVVGQFDQEFSLFIRGKTKIGNVEIDIVLNGTIKHPELKLDSIPSLPPQQLLLMLATGKEWKGLETSVSQGTVSQELTIDFIDYFVLGGTGDKLSQKLGIHDVSVNLDENKTGIAAKKKVTEDIDVGYGIEKSSEDEINPTVTQKLQGEYQLNDKVTVGVEKSVTQDTTPPVEGDKTGQTDEKVYLKFNTQF